MKIPVVIPLLILLALASCSPVNKVTTEVLEPADVAFPEDVYSMALLTAQPNIQINN